MINRYKSIKEKRQRRIRQRLAAVGSRPRLTVFRSNTHIYAQIIDDSQGKTLAAANDLKLTKADKLTKTDKSRKVGEILAQMAKKAKVTAVMFDRGSYRYHGRVKVLAEAVREGGLEF